MYSETEIAWEDERAGKDGGGVPMGPEFITDGRAIVLLNDGTDWRGNERTSGVCVGRSY